MKTRPVRVSSFQEQPFMSRTKLDSPDTTAAKEPVSNPGPERVFRDKFYASRTLVFPDGSTARVIRGLVTAADGAQFELLKAHPDLNHVQE